MKTGLIFIVMAAIMTASFLSSCGSHTKETQPEIAVDSSKGPPPPPPPGRMTKGKFLAKDSLTRYVLEVDENIKSPGKGKPFNTLHYNKVIAYEFEGSEEPYPSVIWNGNFAPVITKQTALSQSQVDRLTSLLSSDNSYGGAFASCFNPHLSLVFYKDTSRVMVIDICLGCNYLIASPDIPATKSRKINAGTESEYAADGFSDQAKDKLKKFCSELGYIGAG